ncbi:hypothetical protein GBA52_014342 [Prunus armeniaca]|nr:hypothetical protein GBA52_014342 [Prunus armeniaca]
MTSDQIGANGQYERNRTLEVSSVCQATQEPRHAHQLYPRQAAQNENLRDGNTIILEELNVETGFSWPHNRVNPRSDGKELEWDEGHVTRGNTLITNWTRASPKERSSRLDLGLIGYPVQVEPYIPNPFGPKINLASTRIISHADTTFHSLGLKRNPEMERTYITKEATIGKGKKRVEGSQRRRFIKAKKTTQGESNKPKGVRGRTRGLFENANLIETIWNTRNRAVFDNCNPHPQRALKSISDQVNEWLLLKHKIAHPTSGNNRQTPQARWITPPTSLAKINVEAAWHQGSCRAGAGIIIRNSEGSFRGAKSISFHVETALDAEAVALLEGCKFAKERNFTKVCFESDSLELIKCVKGNIGRGRWNIYLVFTLIREEQRGFEGCSWNWTNKIGNQAAKNLASLALSRMSKGVWVERPPPPPPPPPHFSCAHSKQGRPSLPSSLLSGLSLV